MDIKELLVERQYQVMKAIANSKRFPEVYELGKEDSAYLVMELLGQDLQSSRIALPNGRFSGKTVSLIAQQLYESLFSLHQAGYLHRDMKPENILRDKHSHNLKIIDFGLAKRWNPQPRQTVSIIGNVRFASRGAHLGFSSRMDDLESAGYVLLYLFQGWLPWQQLPPEAIKKQLDRRNSPNNPIEITPVFNLKESLTAEMFSTSNCLVQQLFLDELIQLIKWIQKIPKTTEPDYSHILYLVGRLKFISGGMQDNCYDWCPMGCQHNLKITRFWNVYDQ